MRADSIRVRACARARAPVIAGSLQVSYPFTVPPHAVRVQRVQSIATAKVGGSRAPTAEDGKPTWWVYDRSSGEVFYAEVEGKAIKM